MRIDPPGAPSADPKLSLLIGSDQRVTQLSPQLRDAMATVGAGEGVDLADLQTGVIAGPGTGLAEGEKVVVNGVDVTVLRIAPAKGTEVLNRGTSSSPTCRWPSG